MPYYLNSVPAYYRGDSGYREWQLHQAQARDIEAALDRSASQASVQTRDIKATLDRNVQQASAQITRAIGEQGEAIAASQQMIADNIAGAARLQTMMLSGLSGQVAETNRGLNAGFQSMSWQLGAISSEFNQGMARLNDTFLHGARNICDKLDAINENISNPLLVKSRELYQRALVSYGKEFYTEALEDKRRPGHDYSSQTGL